MSNENYIKRPTWAYVVAILSALCIIPMGPGMLMLPFMPLMLAGFSTDSGNTDYVMPIMLIGYTILFSWVILLVKAIKSIRLHRRELNAQLKEKG